MRTEVLSESQVVEHLVRVGAHEEPSRVMFEDHGATRIYKPRSFEAPWSLLVDMTGNGVLTRPATATVECL